MSARTGLTEPEAHRYLVLDAVRGVAALGVVLFHLRDAYSHRYGFVSGYLAVDLFFALSGFVIAHAYEAKLRTSMTFAAFLRARFVRLEPLMLLGTLIGAALALAQQLFHLPAAPGWRNILTSLPLNLVMLPNPLIPWGMFLFNAPAWSLFYELAGNAAYAAAIRRLGDRVLGAVALLGLVGLVATVVLRGNLDQGVHLSEWWSALARLGFSFALGILLYRSRTRWGPRMPRPPMSLILLATFAALFVPVAGPARAAYDLGFVLLLSPAILMLGAVSRPAPGMKPVAVWLGLISYPMYALHAPVKHIVQVAAGRFGLVEGLVTLAVILLLSTVAERWYDLPVRRRLARRAPAATPASRFGSA